MNEIKLCGRGGQGVVMASQILGLAFFKAGMYPQCYSLFGGERRGAPVVSFLRVDKERILLKCHIKQPNEMIYVDASLINPEEIRTFMRPGGRILLSTNEASEIFRGFCEFTWGLIDAAAIADSIGLGHTTNTAILGAYCRFTGHFPIAHLLNAIAEMVPTKSEANLKAARQGYDHLALLGGER